MKPKTKPIRDLYFRFIQGTAYDGEINSQELAVAMAKVGTLQLVAHKTKPTIEHYTDVSEPTKSEIIEAIELVLRGRE